MKIEKKLIPGQRSTKESVTGALSYWDDSAAFQKLFDMVWADMKDFIVYSYCRNEQETESTKCKRSKI